MSKEIDFRSFNRAVDTPVFIGQDGTRYQTKPLTVKSAAKFLELAQGVDNDPSKLSAFVKEFAKIIGVPATIFDDLDFDSLKGVIDAFFTKDQPSDDAKSA